MRSYPLIARLGFCAGVFLLGSGITAFPSPESRMNFGPSTSQVHPDTRSTSGNPQRRLAVPAAAGTGAPVIQIQTGLAFFQPTIVGQTSLPQSILISNAGTAPLSINFAQSSATSGFAIASSPSCSVPVAARGSCLFFVTFTPTTGGMNVGTLSVASNDPATPVITLPLTGYGFESYPVPELQYINPPSVLSGSNSVTLTVVGDNFFAASVIDVNGQPVPTTFSNSGLSTTIDRSLLAGLGELQISVTNPAPGGQSASLPLTVYQSLNMQASAVIYDSVGKLLWVAIPASASANANTVVSIDPATGTLGNPIPVASDPRKLAVSSDGQYLYVSSNGLSEIQRINLSTLAIERTFPLPQENSVNTLVNEMHIVPGSSQSIVASLELPFGEGAAGLALFNDSGLVNWISSDFSTGFFAMTSFAFAGNPPVIYGLPFTTVGPVFLTTVTLDNTGLVYSPITGTPNGQDLIAFSVVSDGQLLYLDNGQIWNPATQGVVGSYARAQDNPPSQASSVIPDKALGRTFFLDWTYQTAQTGALAVQANDQATLAVTGVVPFLGPAVGSIDNAGFEDFALWGNNGFAFLAGTSGTGISKSVIIFESTITTSTPGVLPPFLGGTGIGGVPAGSPAMALRIDGMDFVNGSILSWNGTAVPTTFVNSNELSANLPASLLDVPGFFALTVVNPPPSGGTSAPTFFAVTPTAQATLGPASLSFGSQAINVASPPQTVTLQNSGQSPLTIFSISAGGNFSQTNNCGASLPVGASCAVSVTFMPAAAGASQSTLVVSDNAGYAPATVALSGTGTAPDFTVGVAPSGTSSVTVASGQTATYLLSLIGGIGYNGTVGLTCTQVPVGYSCKISPSSMQLQPNVSAAFTATISPVASSLIPLAPEIRIYTAIAASLYLLALLLLLMTTCSTREISSRFLCPANVVIIVTILTVMTGCGGGKTSSVGSSPTQTYTVEIVASDGTTTHNFPITLTVQ